MTIRLVVMARKSATPRRSTDHNSGSEVSTHASLIGWGKGKYLILRSASSAVSRPQSDTAFRFQPSAFSLRPSVPSACVPPHQPHRMCQQRLEHGEAVAHAIGTAGQIDDQGPATHAGD